MLHKNNYLVLGAVAGLLAFSCSKDDVLREVVPRQDQVSRQVSSEEAREFAGFVANKLFSNGGLPRLKSSAGEEQREVSDIAPIVHNSRDTVMYAVNFGKGSGFAILSADKQDFPIVAYVDSGHFDLRALEEDSPLRAWFQEKSAQILHDLRQPADTADQRYQLWAGMTDENTRIEIEFAALPERPATKGPGTRRHSTGKATVYPWTGTYYKWGQKTGYNYNAKYYNYPVGCPAVAVGQLCVHHWFPYKYGYMYMPGQLPAVHQPNAIASMFRDIADSIPNYSWGYYGSGALPNDITTGLKRLGYKNAQLQWYHFETVYSNLSAGNPVLLAGYQGPYGGGHIWFCDGYHEASWLVKRYKWLPFWGWQLTGMWYEYADHLYMNWGWDGNNNGWYEQGNWHPNNGQPNQGHLKQMYVNLYPVYN